MNVYVFTSFESGWGIETSVYKDFESAKRRFLEELSTCEDFDFIVEDYYSDILPTTLKATLDYIVNEEQCYLINEEDFIRFKCYPVLSDFEEN